MKLSSLVAVLLITALSAGSAFGQTSEKSMMYVKNDKNPGSAFALSLIPGAGLMYNDQVPLGLGVFFGVPALIGSGVTLYSANVNRFGSTGLTIVSAALMGLGGLAYVGSMVYAPLKSRAINRSHGDTAFLREHKKRSPSMLLGTTSTGIGMTFRF